MKQYFICIWLLVLISFITAGYNASEQTNSNQIFNTEDSIWIKVADGDYSQHEGAIDSFMERANDGELVSLSVCNDVSGNENVTDIDRGSVICSVLFDGDHYVYAAEGSSTNYQYFYKVSGKLPNAAVGDSIYILADEQYTYDQIAWSTLSSNSEAHLDFVLLGSVSVFLI